MYSIQLFIVALNLTNVSCHLLIPNPMDATTRVDLGSGFCHWRHKHHQMCSLPLSSSLASCISTLLRLQYYPPGHHWRTLSLSPYMWGAYVHLLMYVGFLHSISVIQWYMCVYSLYNFLIFPSSLPVHFAVDWVCICICGYIEPQTSIFWEWLPIECHEIGWN